MISHISVRYSFSSSTSSTAVMFSEIVEKLAMSEKKTVMTRWSTI